MKEWSAVAKVTKLFGLDGEVVLNIYDSFTDEPNNEEPLFAIIDSLTVPLFIESFTKRGSSNAIVRFADIDNPTRATELLSLELYAEKNDDDDNSEDGFFMEDMVGFTATFKGYDFSGKIEDFIDNDTNPLFVLNINGNETLIPAVNQMVASFNIRRKQIKFNTPEGLLELYIQEQPKEL